MHASHSLRPVRHGLWFALETLGLVLIAVGLSWSLLKAIANANLRASEQIRAQATSLVRH